MIPGYAPLEKVPAELNEQLRKLFQFSLAFIDGTTDTVPTRDTLPPNHARFYKSGSTYRIYFNFDDVIYLVALTAA